VADLYLDALLAAAKTPRLMLQATIEGIEARLTQLTDDGRETLAQTVSQAVGTGVEQALEGALARHGQLVVLPAHAHQPLQAAELVQRWACFGQRGTALPAAGPQGESALQRKEQPYD
jgi:hypothetical protein